MMNIPLMAHLVSGYPDEASCRAVAQGLVEGGASYLEIQIPFSDPSADGPSIRDACSLALSRGASVAGALSLVSELKKSYPDIPLFIMAYASLVVTPGTAVFADKAFGAGASGLIIPDLPFDADEGLAEACASAGSSRPGARLSLVSVPVAAPSMRSERLAAMAALGRPYLYAALRAGITGSATEIGDDTRSFLNAAGAGSSKILGGFGIRTGAQARAVAPYVHALVAGSVFVDAIQSALEAQSAGRKKEYSGSPRVLHEALRRAVHDRAAEIVAG